MTKTGSKGTANPLVNYIAAILTGLVIGILGTLAVQQFGGGAGSDPVVAKFKGGSIRASDAFSSIKTRLFDLEDEVFQMKERAILDVIEQKLIQDEAQKQNVTVDQLIEKEMGAAQTNITDENVKQFLTSKGLSLDDPRIRKEDVREYLKFRNKHEKRQAYVAKLKGDANVKLLIKAPAAPKISVATNGFPSWGNENAKVTIVEFSDFQCPFCSRVVDTINQIKKDYGPEKVRIVFRDLPLPSHKRAPFAAKAGLCANEQGKFWEMHDTMFENQRKLEDADLKQYASKVGLDKAKFDECYKSKKFDAALERNKREAQAVGITATPSFVINGTLLQGAQPLHKFKERIERELRG